MKVLEVRRMKPMLLAAMEEEDSDSDSDSDGYVDLRMISFIKRRMRELIDKDVDSEDDRITGMQSAELFNGDSDDGEGWDGRVSYQERMREFMGDYDEDDLS